MPISVTNNCLLSSGRVASAMPAASVRECGCLSLAGELKRGVWGPQRPPRKVLNLQIYQIWGGAAPILLLLK